MNLIIINVRAGTNDVADNLKEMINSKESSLIKILATRNQALQSILDGKDFSMENH